MPGTDDEACALKAFDMNENAARFQRVVLRFDAADREDPRLVSSQGEETPWSLLYHQRLTHWVEYLDPNVSEALRLATRCQHIRRWMIPRSKYPEGVSGYRRWRSDLARFHADQAGQILREAGYKKAMIDRVRDLLMKKGLKHDPEVQLFEDAICLVFLENEFSDFAGKHERDNLVRTFRKIWMKMSPRGHDVAKQLVGEFPKGLQKLVSETVGDI